MREQMECRRSVELGVKNMSSISFEYGTVTGERREGEISLEPADILLISAQLFAHASN